MSGRAKRARKSAPLCFVCGRRPASIRDELSGELPICERCRPNPQVVDDVSEQDRAYFEEHPDETRYYRPAHRGELPPMLPPHDDAELMVEVEQLFPGARIRRPYWFVPLEQVQS